MRSSVNCLQCLVVFISILVTVAGVGLAGVGYVLRFRTELIDGYLSPVLKVIPAGSGLGTDVWTLYHLTAIVFMVIGSFIVLTGILGCMSGICSNQAILISYAVISTTVILCMTTGFAVLLTADVDKDLKQSLRDNLLQYYAGDDGTDPFSEHWNYFMVEFHCCGLESYTNFILTVLWDRIKVIDGNLTSVDVPVTCCKLPGGYPNYGQPYDADCVLNPTIENSYYNKACYDLYSDYLWSYRTFMMGCAAVSAVLETVGMFVVVMMNKRRMDHRRRIATYGVKG